MEEVRNKYFSRKYVLLKSKRVRNKMALHQIGINMQRILFNLTSTSMEESINVRCHSANWSPTYAGNICVRIQMITSYLLLLCAFWRAYLGKFIFKTSDTLQSTWLSWMLSYLSKMALSPWQLSKKQCLRWIVRNTRIHLSKAEKSLCVEIKKSYGLSNIPFETYALVLWQYWGRGTL